VSSYRRVILESPYAADSPEGIRRNVRYARACIRDCLMRGEAPFASHLLYTQPRVLRDEVPEERDHGIQAGFAWRRGAHATVVYTDLGISRGMQYGIEDAEAIGMEVEHRTLEGWEEPCSECNGTRRVPDTDDPFLRYGDGYLPCPKCFTVSWP